jgi:calcium/calmodulin-dependent protein kinase I
MCTLRGLDNKQLAQLREEIAILDRVKDHANINTLVESFWLRKHAVLLCELCSGGELFDSIVAKSYYTEDEARRVVYDVSAALAHCHSLNVVHRDLKPENLLLSHPFGHPQSRVQIADFGLAAAIWSGRGGMTTPCGTAGYVAPEVLERTPYGKEVDVWALGVITYILLCGFPPFHGDSDAEIFRQIRSCSFDYPDEYWEDVSDSACDLIDALLVHDTSSRLSAAQVSASEWVTKPIAVLSPAEAEAAQNVVVLSKAKATLAKFNLRRRFKASALAARALARTRGMVRASHELDAVEQFESDRERASASAKQAALEAAAAAMADGAPLVAGSERTAAGAGAGAGAGGVAGPESEIDAPGSATAVEPRDALDDHLRG